MQQKRKRSWRPKGDPIVLLLSSGFVIAVGMLVFFWPSVSISSDIPSSSASGFSCQVSSVTDGDTLRCADGTRVRLHAVAAREKDETCSVGHPCPNASGAAATAKLSELANGQTLQCQQTGTSYNRVTAICRNEADVEINCAMVRSGTTLIWPRFNAERAICQ
ncbi:hypothetical protein OSJ57_25215 [Sphingomonas sp. HH69]